MANDPRAGAYNLLSNCLSVKPGESVLLVVEQTDELYQWEVATSVEDCLNELGACTTLVSPALINDPVDFPEDIANQMKVSDHTLFLSRVGDYVRFVPLPGNGSRAISYTLNINMLAAPYATIDHQLMLQLQQKLESELMTARQWHIECPLGTDLQGVFCWPSLSGGNDDDLTAALFPVATFKPVPCNTASGQVALSRWLMPGGATKIDNALVAIENVTMAKVNNGYLESFTGPPAEVEKLNRHYDYISNTLGINRNRIHSWHAGINPQTFFDLPANDHLDLWCAVSFASPKYLHFHTCGDEPPGEVAWSVFDPTITIDETVFWDSGEFVWLHRKDNKALIDSYEGAELLLHPSLPIGVGA